LRLFLPGGIPEPSLISKPSRNDKSSRQLPVVSGQWSVVSGREEKRREEKRREESAGRRGTPALPAGQRALQDVSAHGYYPSRGAFTQYYGSDNLDASLLMIPLIGFCRPPMGASGLP
jgi:hypothetical protein